MIHVSSKYIYIYLFIIGIRGYRVQQIMSNTQYKAPSHQIVLFRRVRLLKGKKFKQSRAILS